VAQRAWANRHEVIARFVHELLRTKEAPDVAFATLHKLLGRKCANGFSPIYVERGRIVSNLTIIAICARSLYTGFSRKQR